MASWIEIPACRVYEVPMTEFREEFELINEEGSFVRAIRKRDGKVFRGASVLPWYHVSRDVIHLQEL